MTVDQMRTYLRQFFSNKWVDAQPDKVIAAVYQRKLSEKK